jgi:tol-pal system protein YbgF
MRAKISKIVFTSLFAAFVSAALNGCGPGFPIMTREQETLMDNVDRLVKENADLKKRLDAIEGGGSSSMADLNKTVDDMKRAVAETTVELDKIRQDFSFVQGKLDESGHEGDRYKDSMKSTGEAVESASRKLDSLEARVIDADKKLEALKASVEAQAKASAELKESVLALDKRTAAVEGRLAGTDTARAAKKTVREEPDAMYNMGYQEVADKNYPAALETFTGFLADFPDHKFAGNAQYWIGEIYYARGEWEKAILEFDKVVKKYPSSEKVPASLLKQGFAFEKIGSAREARLVLGSLIERFPKSPEAGLAKKRLDSKK